MSKKQKPKKNRSENELKAVGPGPVKPTVQLPVAPFDGGSKTPAKPGPAVFVSVEKPALDKKPDAFTPGKKYIPEEKPVTPAQKTVISSEPLQGQDKNEKMEGLKCPFAQSLEPPVEDQLPMEELPAAPLEVIVSGVEPEPAPAPTTPPPAQKFHAPHPLKIAFLTWESLHSIPIGGIAVHVTELAAALERQGNEVHVFTRLAWHGQAQYELIDGVHYHRVPYAGHQDCIEEANNMCRAFVSSVFHVEDYMGTHFDIVHAHDWMTSNAMVWIKQGRARKGILTIHSTEYGRCGNNFYGGPSARIMQHERHGTFCADRIITVSYALKNEVMWIYNLPDWKVHSIYNGVNYRHFDVALDAGDVKRRYHMHPYDPMILFAGRMAYQKGPDILVEAIPMVLCNFPTAKFVFAGEGHLRGRVEQRARQLGVAHATRFLGQQNAWTLRDLFLACECVCVPSRNEPFGIVVLEGWSARKPVIGTNNGGPGELIWHDVTGFKINPQPESIAWGIGTLFGNFEHARWMGQNGRAAVERDFSWDIIAEHTYKTYMC